MADFFRLLQSYCDFARIDNNKQMFLLRQWVLMLKGISIRIVSEPSEFFVFLGKEFSMKITVAGVGYVGLSLAVLLAQKHEVTAITTTEKKAEKLNQFISPIQDDEIERFFKETREGKRKLDLHTTTKPRGQTRLRRYK